MTFLQPWAVWFLAGVPVIVALYFLRHRRRSRVVSTQLFWQRAANETSRRALFQRLRHVLSLLLQLLIFGLLVAALARPSLERAVASGASTVIILDARARMQAVEPDGQTRLVRALSRARAEIGGASEVRQTALIVLGAQPEVVVPFVADEKPLAEMLETIKATAATSDVAAALRLADGLLASRQGEKQVVLLSDRQAPTVEGMQAPVRTEVCGSARDNVAITQLSTRPLPGNPETSEMLLEIQNFGAQPVTSEVELAMDGRPFEVKPFTLGPGEKRLEMITSVARPGRSAKGWVTAKLGGKDALAVDDAAYAVLPPLRPARVLLVSAGNPFLEKFLGVDAMVKYQLLEPAAWQPALASKFEVVIFDRVLPPGFDLAQAEGNYLFLNDSPFGAGTSVDQPLVTEVEAGHPATRHVNLQNVAILRARALSVPPERDGWRFTAPLRSFDHALLVVGERRSQRLAALAFDVLESDLPLRVAFPLLMNNTLHWLAGERVDATRSVVAGESVPLADGELAASDPVTAPSAKAVSGTVPHLFQPSQPGYYAVTQAEATRWLAVNAFSVEESDLRGAGGASSAGLTRGTATWAAWPPWQWLTLGALLLFSLEWWMFHRRKTE